MHNPINDLPQMLIPIINPIQPTDPCNKLIYHQKQTLLIILLNEPPNNTPPIILIPLPNPLTRRDLNPPRRLYLILYKLRHQILFCMAKSDIFGKISIFVSHWVVVLVLCYKGVCRENEDICIELDY